MVSHTVVVVSPIEVAVSQRLAGFSQSRVGSFQLEAEPFRFRSRLSPVESHQYAELVVCTSSWQNPVSPRSPFTFHEPVLSLA